MRIIKFILILLSALLLSSCSAKDQTTTASVQPTAVTAEAETINEPSREAVFVYNNPGKTPKQITLVLGGEPILLPSGYARLSGVVSGEKRIACLDIGGRGLALGIGEKVEGYQVIRIGEDKIELRRN